MSEPAVIMNLHNLDRAQRAIDEPERASAKELRYAVRYYRAYNRDVKRQAENARTSRDFYAEEWGDTNWTDTTNSVLNDRIERNSRTLRALNRELKRRKQ